MNVNNIKIAVSGINGKMGSKIIKEIIQIHKTKNKNIFLGGVLYNRKNQINTSLVSILNKLNVKIVDNLSKIKNDFDVLIDFTHPTSSIEYLQNCKKYNKKIVIGTTGFNKIQKLEISKISKNIAIVLSPNFSIGLNVMLKLLKQTTKIIGEDSDIEIIEMHHKKKIDKPSGTAIAMGETISNTLGVSFNKCFIDRNINIKNNIQKSKYIGFSSLRAGNIVGEHTALFIKKNERLEIVHKSSNRSIFANGAIKAAIWLVDKNQGLFNMNHVLNI
ncbi:MAG: 4-hydroxy-tetrahydrodipicolinate reductase [Enterobacterales bacterium]